MLTIVLYGVHLLVSDFGHSITVAVVMMLKEAF
jgi:hypothetical protein